MPLPVPHDAVLREGDCIAAALLPHFRRAQTRLHQSSAQIVKQFCVDFVVVFRGNSVESGKSLPESRREGCYPRGGRSSDGVAGGTLSVPANRSIACRTAPARRIDSLHCRCLTSNLLASGGGAVAFIANIATNSSRVISGRGMASPSTRWLWRRSNAGSFPCPPAQSASQSQFRGTGA
jgi:hypothetical protein